MHKNQMKKNCVVCGDNAIWRNLGAIVCESCKAFFRRTAFKSDGLVCGKNGKCVINTQNRRTSCKMCRLNKCLASGMRRELILNKNEKLSADSPNLNDSDLEQSTGSTRNSSVIPVNKSSLRFSDFCQISECFLTDEEMSEAIAQIEEFIDSSTFSAESKAEETIKLTKNSVVALVRPIATYNKALNDVELMQLQELFTASNCLESLSLPLTQNIIQISSLKEYYTNVLSIDTYDRYAREFVRFCKKLSAFKAICQDDQCALIKYGYMESARWQQIVLYNFDEQNWVILGNGCTFRFSLEILKFERMDWYNIYRDFFRRLSRDWILDPTLRNLLSAVSLFDPNRPYVKDKELIKLKQQMYLYLLQKYLLQIYGSECESMEKCSQMLGTIEDMKIVNHYAKEIEREYKEYLTPLLKAFID